jgi:hypothetical protein
LISERRNPQKILPGKPISTGKRAGRGKVPQPFEKRFAKIVNETGNWLYSGRDRQAELGALLGPVHCVQLD